MNSYHIRLSHVVGILANANDRTACSRLCLVVAHTSSIPGNLARGQDVYSVFWTKGWTPTRSAGSETGVRAKTSRLSW